MLCSFAIRIADSSFRVSSVGVFAMNAPHFRFCYRSNLKNAGGNIQFFQNSVENFGYFTKFSLFKFDAQTLMGKSRSRFKRRDCNTFFQNNENIFSIDFLIQQKLCATFFKVIQSVRPGVFDFLRRIGAHNAV